MSLISNQKNCLSRIMINFKQISYFMIVAKSIVVNAY